MCNNKKTDMLDPFLLFSCNRLKDVQIMYKYVSKTKYRFGICISIGVRQLKFISLSLFVMSVLSKFLFFSILEFRKLHYRAAESFETMHGEPVPRENGKTHLSIPNSSIGGSTNFWEEGGGGGVLQPLLSRLICPPSWFRSGKRDLVQP